MTRIWLFVAFLLFVVAQRDGFWKPAESAAHEPLLELSGLLLLVLLQVIFVAPQWLGWRSRTFAVWRGITMLAGLLQAASGVLFYLGARYYQPLGYRLFPLPTLLVFLSATVLVFGLGVWTKPVRPAILLGAAMVCLGAAFCLTMASSPLVVPRSDMLPLIAAAGRSFLAGQDPYHAYGYTLGGLFLTYLPGTWLAYLPAGILHVDLRWITLACYCLVMLVIYRGVRVAFRQSAAALLALFFCSPYLQYRHEIYTAPHWLCLTASLLLAFRGRAGWSGVLMGMSIAMSQFSWVVYPFYLLFWVQRYGWRRAAAAAGSSFAAMLVVAGPFLIWSPQAMLYGVLGHWQGLQLNARPANFSYGLAAVVGAGHLQLVQAAAIGVLGFYCIATKACRTPEGLMRWLTTALLLFVLLNFLVWGYFFLMILLLTLIGVFAANDWLILETPASSSPTLVAVSADSFRE